MPTLWMVIRNSVGGGGVGGGFVMLKVLFKAHSETKLDFFVLYVLFLPFVTAGADGAKKLLREIVILPYLRPEVFLVVQ